jgi:hypothetical protein
LREPVPETPAEHPDFARARGRDGRLYLSAKDPRFWPAAGVVLDVLAAMEARVGDAAERLDLSTGNLIDFLQTDPKLWQTANQLLARLGQKPLR